MCTMPGKLEAQDTTSCIPALHFMFQIRFKLALLELTLAFLNKDCQSL